MGKLIRNAEKATERRREEEKRFDEEVQREIQKLRQEGKFTPTVEQERYWSRHGFPGANTSPQLDSEFLDQIEPECQNGFNRKQDEEQTAIYQTALSLFNTKEFDEAMDHCDTLLSMTPHAETFLLRAMIWANRQSYMNVLEDCTRAIAIDPTLQAAYWGRGTAFKHLIENSSWIKLEWRKSAIADFSKVHPDSPHFHEAKQAVLEMESGSYLFNMLIHQFVTYLTYPIHLLFGNR